MFSKNDRGMITLEACVSLLAFLSVMLLLSGLFVIFMAQNVTAHVALQTAESLSLDSYRIEALMKEEGKIGSVGDNLGQFITKLFGSSSDNPSFVTDHRWYKDDSTDVADVVKTRFVGYLAGGDISKADDFLERMNVVDGLDGLDFSGSYVENDNLYIVLKYRLKSDFNLGNLGIADIEQTTCSRLWK